MCEFDASYSFVVSNHSPTQDSKEIGYLQDIVVAPQEILHSCRLLATNKE